MLDVFGMQQGGSQYRRLIAYFQRVFGATPPEREVLAQSHFDIPVDRKEDIAELARHVKSDGPPLVVYANFGLTNLRCFLQIVLRVMVRSDRCGSFADLL